MTIPSEYLLGAVILLLWLTIYVMISTLLNKARVIIGLENSSTISGNFLSFLLPPMNRTPERCVLSSCTFSI